MIHYFIQQAYISHIMCILLKFLILKMIKFSEESLLNVLFMGRAKTIMHSIRTNIVKNGTVLPCHFTVHQ